MAVGDDRGPDPGVAQDELGHSRVSGQETIALGSVSEHLDIQGRKRWATRSEYVDWESAENLAIDDSLQANRIAQT